MSIFNQVAKKTGQFRLALVEGAVGPKNEPFYLDCSSVSGLSQNRGGREEIKCPSPTYIGRYKTVGFTSEPEDDVEGSITSRMHLKERDKLSQLALYGGPLTAIIRSGGRANFFDYKGKVFIVPDIEFDNIDFSDLMSFESDEPVDITTDFSAPDWYEINRMTFKSTPLSGSQSGAGSVSIYDRGPSFAEDCDRFVFFAYVLGAAENYIGYSLDNGESWNFIDLAPYMAFTSGQEGYVIAEGGYVYIASTVGAENAIFYAEVDEIIKGNTTFQQMDAPNNNWVYSFRSKVDGYVYSLTNSGGGMSMISYSDPFDWQYVVQNFGAVDPRQMSTYDGQVFAGMGSDANTLFYSGNCGKVWTSADFSVLSGSANTVASVEVMPSGTAIVVDSAGILWCSDDGFATLTQYNNIPFGNGGDGRVYAVTANVAHIVRTANYGLSVFGTYPGSITQTYDHASVGTNAFGGIDSLAEYPNLVMFGFGNQATAGEIVIGYPW